MKNIKTKKSIIIRSPKKFNKKKNEVLAFITKYDPFSILEKITARKFKITKFILQHKDLKKEARFKHNIIYVDFNNPVEYIWLCLSHELAHIILRSPSWIEKKYIKKIIDNKKGVYSKYQYNFSYAIEQTMAILLQAACEDKAGIRKLKWENWKDTFKYMGVRRFGNKLWKPWLQYLANQSRYKNIDRWILKMLKKNYTR